MHTSRTKFEFALANCSGAVLTGKNLVVQISMAPSVFSGSQQWDFVKRQHAKCTWGDASTGGKLFDACRIATSLEISLGNTEDKIRKELALLFRVSYRSSRSSRGDLLELARKTL
jgi:hypothetical protein